MWVLCVKPDVERGMIADTFSGRHRQIHARTRLKGTKNTKKEAISSDSKEVKRGNPPTNPGVYPTPDLFGREKERFISGNGLISKDL